MNDNTYKALLIELHEERKHLMNLLSIFASDIPRETLVALAIDELSDLQVTPVNEPRIRTDLGPMMAAFGI